MDPVDTVEEMARTLSGAGAGLTGERAVLNETLAKHRMLLRHTVSGVTEADARRRTTVSALTLAGLLKHVIDVEDVWVGFVTTGVVRGAEGWAAFTPDAVAGDSAPERDDFTLDDGDTVAGLLAHWDDVAARTAGVLATADLDVAHPLPPAPWFPPGGTWSGRHALAHVIGEIAQHSGHADILRESLDGQRTMG